MIGELSNSEHGEANVSLGENKDGVLGPLKENEKIPLSKINSEDFEREQKNCVSLAEIWKLAEDVSNREFEVRKDRLIRISHS